MEIFHNPLVHPLFIPIMRTLVYMLVGGFLFILFYGRFNFKKIFGGELGHRYVSWLVMAPLFVLSILAGGIVAFSILYLFILKALKEFKSVTGLADDYYRFLIWYSFFSLIVTAVFPVLSYGIIPLTLLILTLFPISKNAPEELYTDLHFAFRAFLYITWPMMHVILMRQLPEGTQLLLIVGFGVALSDIFAYIVGKKIGKHKIAPKISPNKAYEGILGDLIGAALAVFLLKFALPSYFTPGMIVLLIVIIGLGSSWGDLVSSLAKRASGTKDWGDTIPGHGGILDRLNSAIVTIPLVYYFVILSQLL